MRALLTFLVMLPVGCSSGSATSSPSATASFRVSAPRPAPSRTGPSFLEDTPIPSAVPLPVASTPAGPPKASCDMRAKRGTCVDFYRPTPNEKGDCESVLAGGKYGSQPCPTDKAIGYCTTFDGDRRHYYEGKAPEGYGSGIDDAKLGCETRRFVPAK